MTIYDLKPRFQNLLRPLVTTIWKMGITPNQVTIFTCFFSIFFGLLVLLSSHNFLFYIFPVFFFIRMALNAIDGMLAKEHKMQSKLGAILNEMTDVVSDAFLYYAFIRLSFINSHLLLFIIFFSSVSELVGLAALLNHAPRQYAGPMGKSDRAFVFGVLSLFVGAGFENPLFYNCILGITAVLLLKTINNRIRKSVA